MVGDDEAQGHREQEAGSNEARWGQRWDVEKPASSAHNETENEAYSTCDHDISLLRRRSNRSPDSTDQTCHAPMYAPSHRGRERDVLVAVAHARDADPCERILHKS